MKQYLYFLLAILIQTNALGQNYPDIDQSIRYEQSDFSEIDELLNEGLPNKAISKLLTKQLIANSSQNLRDIRACYSRLEQAFRKSGKENEDIQNLFFEQHKIFEKSSGPARNVSAKSLIGLLNDWFIRRSFSFDEESLDWPIKGKSVKLENGNVDVLQDYYASEMMKGQVALMRISSLALYDTNEVKYQPTLFDVYAWRRINELKYAYSADRSTCFYQSTGEFVNLNLSEANQLFAKLEQLNKKYARWDAYAHIIAQRMDYCDEGESSEVWEKANARFQKELIKYPASNRFALRRANYFANQANDYDWKSPSNKDNGFVLALKIVEQALNDHPESDFTDELNAYKKKLTKSSLSFGLNDLKHPSKRSLLSVTYRNVVSAHIAIYKVLSYKTEDPKERNPLKKLNVELRSEQELTFDKDDKMLTHTKDFLMSDLDEVGDFLVIIAPTKDEINKAFTALDLQNNEFSFQILNLTNLILRNSVLDNGYSILVNDARTGKPIEGAVVKAEPRYKYQEDGIASEGVTDENGFYLIEGSNSFKYTVEYKGDKTSSDGYYRNTIGKDRESYKVYTDRSIYRPGQTVYFKTLSLEKSGQKTNLIKNNSVSIKFLDQNSEVIYSEELKSNAYGSASGSFVLPKKGFPLGSVRISINDLRISSLQVEEYKRPTFEVTFDKPKGRVVLGESFTMTGKVMAYAGYPISNADVVISISESRFFPRWCFVLDEWRSYDTTMVVTTDADGIFSFDYTSDKPKDAYGVYYNFDGIVTDLSGEVQMANHSLYLGKTAYSIRGKVANKYKTNEDIDISARVFNSQNEEQKAVELGYEIEKMDTRDWYLNNIEEAQFKGFSRKDFVRHYPKTRYYKDQKERFESVVSGKMTAGDNTILEDLPTGNYRLVFSTVDEVGDTITSKHEFIVWNPKLKWRQHKSEFWIETSNRRPVVGEEVEIYVGSSHRKVSLLIAKYNDDGIVSMEYKKMRKRKHFTQLITEEDKAGLVLYYSIVKNGVVSSLAFNLTPLDSSKNINLKLKSISEPLRPGTAQSWEIELSQKGVPTTDAELLVGMYDASLDAFMGHSWSTRLEYKPYISANWNANYFRPIKENRSNWNHPGFYLNLQTFRSKVNFGMYDSDAGGDMKNEAAPMIDGYGVGNVSSPGGVLSLKDYANDEMDLDDPSPAKEKASPRENFNETAFFKPQVYASPDGTYKWSFTLPDALTKWKMMAFAHTTDLKTGYTLQTFEARKELMLETFEPRFWRKGDSLFWVGKVVNLSETEQTVTVNLKIESLIDETNVSSEFGDFQTQIITLKPNESKAVEWPIAISEMCPNFVRFEAEASTDEFADVVRKNMPVLEGKTRITLAQNYVIDEKGIHDIQIDDIKNVSDEAEVISYSVSTQKQPLWSTMLSLTHILRPINELNESYFSQYFGATLAKKILNDHPLMKQALSNYQVTDADALKSNLMKNEELKAIILAETPWLLEAKSETEQLNRLGQLLDENHLNSTIEDALDKLTDMQLPDGSWSWVGRDRSSWYMTQYFAKGIAELAEYGVEIDEEILKKAIKALDAEYTKRYNRLQEKDKLKEYGLGAMEIEYLYIRSVLGIEATEAVTYYGELIPKKWTKFNLSTQATIGQWALNTENQSLAKKILASFQDKAQSKNSLGKYWRANEYGYGWFEDKIETHARLIAFYQRYGDMGESVAAMQKWLLIQKQTQMWDTPKSTAMACFALKDFNAGTGQQTVHISFPGETSSLAVGLDFAKKSPLKEDLESAKKGAQVLTETKGLVFASAQVVYTDKLSNISKSTGDFRLERHYYILDQGKEVEISDERLMKVGDVVRVKIKLISDRDMDFVYMEDPKASGWEPKNALSGYRYDNGYYYLSNRDSKTEFFIENLRKGTYIYMYEVKVTAKGKLQVGPAKATCYYAPSFSSNTEGEKFEIEK